MAIYRSRLVCRCTLVDEPLMNLALTQCSRYHRSDAFSHGSSLCCPHGFRDEWDADTIYSHRIHNIPGNHKLSLGSTARLAVWTFPISTSMYYWLARHISLADPVTNQANRVQYFHYMWDYLPADGSVQCQPLSVQTDISRVQGGKIILH